MEAEIVNGVGKKGTCISKRKIQIRSSCLPDIENLDELMMISITFCVGWKFNHLLEVWPELTAWDQWKLANSHIPTAEAEGIENMMTGGIHWRY